jgi:hypothetical protein
MKRLLILTLLALTGAAACSVLAAHVPNKETKVPTCTPLPVSFAEDDLVGTWIAEYFGGLATDRLQIRKDGSYTQTYSSEVLRFEGASQRWSLQYDAAGYAILHLGGMRRCDDISSICTNQGGGLPVGEYAINQCTGEYMTYTNEVVLFVTGAPNMPRGIELQHARLAGSDWYYTFKLIE